MTLTIVIDQVVAAIIADDDRVQAVRTWREAADHELLAEIHSMLYPGSATLARFVNAVPLFPDDAFQCGEIDRPDPPNDMCLSVYRSFRQRNPLRFVVGTPTKRVSMAICRVAAASKWSAFLATFLGWPFLLSGLYTLQHLFYSRTQCLRNAKKRNKPWPAPLLLSFKS